MTRNARRRRRHGTNGGFAAVEYVLTVGIMGLIIATLVSAMVVVLRNQESSVQRNDAGNGSLGVTNYFPADIASTPPGARETTATLDTGCTGYADSGHNVIRLTWTELLYGTTTSYRVAYRIVPVGLTSELLRVSCEKTSGSYGSAKVRKVAFAIAALPDAWSAGDEPAVISPLSGDGTVTLTISADNGTTFAVQGTRMNPNESLAPYVPPSPNAALETTLTLAVANYSTVGELLAYTVTISNTGSVPLTGVGSLLTNATATSACATTLAASVTTTCSATHTVTQAELDSGTISAGIDAYGFYGSVAPTASVTNTIGAAGSPGVAVLLTPASPGYSEGGETLSYTTTVTNTGNLTLTALSASYTNATEDAACSPLPLSPGQSATCTATHVVATGEYGYPVVNTAMVTGTSANFGDTAPTSSAETSVPFLANPQIAITSFTAAPSPITTLGETVTFTVTLENTGNLELTGVGVTNSLSTTATSCATTLAVGATTSCTSTYVVTQADLDSGGIEDTVSASGYYLANVSTAEATVNVPTSATPSVSVLMTTPDTSYSYAGDVLDYTLQITNTGNITLWTLARTYTNATGSGVACAPQPLAPGGVATCNATHTVTSGEVGSAIVVSATASGWSPLWGFTNTEATAPLSTPLLADPTLTVTSFSASPSPFTGSGQTVTFTTTIQNTGNVALASVGVTYSNSTAATSCATSLAVGATTTCTSTHTTTTGEITTGVLNTVTATGSYSGNTVTAQSTMTVPVAVPCTVTSSTSGGIALPTSVGRVPSNSDGKKDMLLSDVTIILTTTGSCSGLRIKYFPKTPSSVLADLTEYSSGSWTYAIPGQDSADPAKWSAGVTQVQVLPSASVGSTAIYTNTAAFTVT